MTIEYSTHLLKHPDRKGWIYMKHKFFITIFSLLLVFSLAVTAQPAAGLCAPKKIKLNVKKLTLPKNDTYTLRIYNLKKKHTVDFFSDDENIATVKETSANGKTALVTPVNIGSTNVRANIYNRKGKLVRTLKTHIRVTPLAVSVKFAQRKVRLNVSEIMRLSVLIKPDLSQEIPLFESSDPDIVAVNSKGIITAIAPGNATITATLLSSGQKAACDVSVSPSPTMEPDTDE